MDKPEKVKKQKQIVTKLRVKYRLLIIDENSYAEKFSWRLSPMNVISASIVSGIIIMVVVTLLIALTPLREYIPGYPDLDIRKNAEYSVEKADSLEQVVEAYDNYIHRVRVIMQGGSFNDSIQEESPDEAFVLEPDNRIAEDSAFRVQVEDEDRFNISSAQSSSIETFLFFTPVRGEVTSSYNKKTGHYGVDIATAENETIKSCLDGTVISADFTSGSGNSLMIQHRNNVISSYKHCSQLLKKPGDVVKAGEVIGFVGNTGKHTTGPHLHFEIWDNGRAVDPETLIAF